MKKRNIANRVALCLLTAMLGIGSSAAGFDDPFGVTIDASNTSSGMFLSVAFSIPDEHILYANETSVEGTAGTVLERLSNLNPKRKEDAFSGEIVGVYDADETFIYQIVAYAGTNIEGTIRYQGCDATRCFFPQTKTFRLSVDGKGTAGQPAASGDTPPSTVAADDQADWREIAHQFNVRGTASGYLSAEDFLSFLRGNAVKNGAVSGTDINTTFEKRGLLVSLLLILLGGLALNLTPCVLPMIPVNLAIIGAGTQGGSRSRGFLLGGAYGLGIALTYGLLGLLVAFGGARFGTINSSPWFNLFVAILFLVLSLAMFGAFNLDFSRLQNRMGPQSRRTGSLLAALGMGAVAALLAGACVAPVVISVLLLAVDLYQEGNLGALFLPFLLGIGMALPWPFAGAGMSFLPKPGKWMERIKYAFGFIILAVSIYYAVQTYRLFADRHVTRNSFAAMLAKADTEGKPVLIDFWATWCKNCTKMENSTFVDPDVVQEFKRFTVLKYQAEDLNDTEVKAVMDHYGIQGLPTYVILTRKAADE